jgi:hypothetical protein
MAAHSIGVDFPDPNFAGVDGVEARNDPLIARNRMAGALRDA